MKYLYMLLIFMLVFSGCKSKDDSTNGKRVDKKQALTSFTINLDGVDNLIVQDVEIQTKTDGSISFASYGGDNLFYNKDGQLFTVDIPDGYTVKKVKDVKKSDNIAITFYVDATPDVLTVSCIVDPAEQICDLGLWEPRKLSNLGNSPYLKKIGENIYYLKGNEFTQKSSITGSSNSISFATIPTGYVSQIAINDSGAIMVDNGTEISISDSFNMVIPDISTVTGSTWTAALYPNENKFFFPHKSGFFIKSGGNFKDFYRLSDSSGDLDIRYAQYNSRWREENIGDINHVPIVINSDLSGCTSHIVGDKDIVVCGANAYDLGDASNDMKQIDFVWCGHESVSDQSLVRIVSDDNFLYYYSHSDFNGDRLTRIDLENNEYLHIFSSPGDTYKINSASINNGTYRACTDNSALEITNVDATPDITETIGGCDQIVSF